MVGCFYEVGVGEGGVLLSVSVLNISASLFFSSFGGCYSSEFTSGASAEAGGALTTVEFPHSRNYMLWVSRSLTHCKRHQLNLKSLL